LTPKILDQIRQLAADIFGVPLGAIGPESSPENIEAWDSIQHLNLVLAVEEKFSLQLSPEEIEQMSSVGAIVAIVESRRSESLT